MTGLNLVLSITNRSSNPFYYTHTITLNPSTMIKKILIIIAVLNLIGLINSCCETDLNYKWIGVSSEIIDNSAVDPVICHSDSVNKMAYGIRLHLKDSFLFYTHLPTFFNSTYATSCNKKYIGIHTIKNITIKTLYDFDDVKLKNADISDYFLARISIERSYYSSIAEIANRLNDRDNLTYDDDDTFDLFLMKQPSKTDTCRFKIEINLSDSSSISCTTRTIKLY